MKRTYCDGCWRDGDGTLTDITGLKTFRVSITKAHILELCERCAPRFERFVLERERLLILHSEEFKDKLKRLQNEVWDEVKRDASAEAEH